MSQKGPRVGDGMLDFVEECLQLIQYETGDRYYPIQTIDIFDTNHKLFIQDFSY